MAKPEKPASDVLKDSGEDVKRAAKAGPAGILPVTVIVLALLAIVVLGIMLLASRH